MRFGVGILVLVLSVVVSRLALAQSYGPGDQTLTIPAIEFQVTSHECSHQTDDWGYVALGCQSYVALNLPEGAHITQMCLYANNLQPGDFVISDVEETLLPAAGQSPGKTVVPGSSLNANFSGYGAVCTDALDYVLHSTVNSEHQVHRVFAQSQGNSPARLGGVRITWHREVSPLPASSSFDDVPLDSQYSQFIEALKASGITAGCQASPPLYCPDRPITRAEMAVYLSLALGLHWVD